MSPFFIPRWLFAVVVLVVLVVVGVVLLWRGDKSEPILEPEALAPVEAVLEREIGRSVQGRPLMAYTYGSGDTHLLFVGGIHGGYEWNSVLLAYAFMDHFEADPNVVPSGIKVTIVPVANPDGLFAIIGKEGRFAAVDVPADPNTAGKGRFNANNVDLNRNFDCKWAPESSWRGATVSAGTRPFSEPEAVALRDLILEDKPDAAIFWHSQANAVYGSECTAGILATTTAIMNAYARAGSYAAVPAFTSYPITGDVEGWLASVGVPAITVELETRTSIEWPRNLAGVQALFDFFAP